MSYHPDSATAEALERNARAVTQEVVAPPPELADNPAAYIQWLREQRPQLQPRQSVPKEFNRLYDRNIRGSVPVRRGGGQEFQEANPLAWAPTPEEAGRLDGHGAARYGAAASAQNDARNDALAGLAAQARSVRAARVPAPRRPIPSTKQELEAERARQLAELQRMIEEQQREGGAS
jgi:hypothetical protein